MRRPARPTIDPALPALCGAALAAAAVTIGGGALAGDPAAPPSPTSPATASAGAPTAPPTPKGKGGKVWDSCAEVIPSGATRPLVSEKFPERGTSGYAAALEITLTHGKGETVLPAGFKVQASSDALRMLEEAGFTVPDQDGGSPATIEREERESSAVTKVTIPFVPLPPDPGRTEMVLPSLPIAVSRASGEMMTLCTRLHPILVEDPTVNEPDPKVKPNPPPRPQREDWPLARHVAIGTVVGAIVAAIAAWLFARWRSRPRVVEAPPPRLPWVVALEELEAVRRSSLLAEGKADEYFDRVSDSVRKYLGARYGFDGLETTTDEMRAILRRVVPPIPGFGQIVRFLEDCDLVKFARVVPGEDECIAALERGETIVRTTIPPAKKADPAPKEAA